MYVNTQSDTVGHYSSNHCIYICQYGIRRGMALQQQSLYVCQYPILVLYGITSSSHCIMSICNLTLYSITVASTVVLKGIIRYSDYSFTMVIFECFKSNGIFVVLLKPYIQPLEWCVYCSLLCNGHLKKGFWMILKICMLHFQLHLAIILLIRCFAVSYFTHGIGQ